MRATFSVILAACALSTTAAGQPLLRQPLLLRYRQPAADWQSQALPIGNGRLGAMIFGDPQHEHLQLNEISLWTGDEKDTGSYQNLADLLLDLTHGAVTLLPAATRYRHSHLYKYLQFWRHRLPTRVLCQRAAAGNRAALHRGPGGRLQRHPSLTRCPWRADRGVGQISCSPPVSCPTDYSTRPTFELSPPEGR